MNAWWLGVAIFLFLEGLFVAISPTTWRKMMQELIALSDRNLRQFGITLLALAFVILLMMLWMH